jgi:hypothetical protein
MILKPFTLFNRYIKKKLLNAPARLYITINRLPNRKPDKKTRIIFKSSASFQPYRYKTNTTARFANPSFTPGTPK